MVAFSVDISLSLIVIIIGVASVIVISSTNLYITRQNIKANKKFVQLVKSFLINVPTMSPENYIDLIERWEAYAEFLKGNKEPLDKYWEKVYGKKLRGVNDHGKT